MEILKPKVSYSGIGQMVAVGVVKQLEERLTSPIIGNGSFVSGGVKLIAGALLDGKAGTIGRVASNAFLVDAGEDLAVAVMGLLGGGGIGIGGAGGAAGDEFGV